MPFGPQDFRVRRSQGALCHDIIDQPQTAMNPVAYLRSSPQQLSDNLRVGQATTMTLRAQRDSKPIGPVQAQSVWSIGDQ